jgi:hypothetical protein
MNTDEKQAGETIPVEQRRTRSLLAAISACRSSLASASLTTRSQARAGFAVICNTHQHAQSRRGSRAQQPANIRVPLSRPAVLQIEDKPQPLLDFCHCLRSDSTGTRVQKRLVRRCDSGNIHDRRLLEAGFFGTKQDIAWRLCQSEVGSDHSNSDCSDPAPVEGMCLDNQDWMSAPWRSAHQTSPRAISMARAPVSETECS